MYSAPLGSTSDEVVGSKGRWNHAWRSAAAQWSTLQPPGAMIVRLLKKVITFILDPPGEPEGPDPFTLAVPDAQSTFKRGAVGWAHRPPARVRCRSCNTEFDHEYANDVIRCPICPAEHRPEEFTEVDLLEMSCPHCEHTLNHGIRHPNIFEVPEWAACPSCQYHWEFQHSYK